MSEKPFDRDEINSEDILAVGLVSSLVVVFVGGTLALIVTNPEVGVVVAAVLLILGIVYATGHVAITTVNKVAAWRERGEP